VHVPSVLSSLGEILNRTGHSRSERQT
jgi:hypothetical protein